MYKKYKIQPTKVLNLNKRQYNIIIRIFKFENIFIASNTDFISYFVDLFNFIIFIMRFKILVVIIMYQKLSY